MILSQDKYEIFDNTALVLDNEFSGEYIILSVNFCALPNKLVALDIEKYPWVLNFLIENHFATYDGSKVVSENKLYPVVALTEALAENVDVSNILEKYMKGNL